MTLRSVLAFTGLVLSLFLVSCSPSQEGTPAHGKTPEVDQAVEAYRAWVLTEADAFVGAAGEFVAAILAGDREKAKALYAPSRMHFERIEPIAEALGDFDPRLDAREGDVPDEDWRGYHKLEKLLWSTDDLKAGFPVAETLLTDVKLLRAQLETAEITAPAMVAGAVELLNEISSSKVTGEEERYSRTDLWDFLANLQGSEQVWQLLSPAVRTSDPELAKTLDARFSLLYGLLDVQKKHGVFRPYNEVYPKEVQALAAAVDALAEPMAQLGRHYPSE